jgi:hypothetical protein
MATLDIVMLIFLTVVLIGGLGGFFIYNNKKED